jgi:hypothetical protein
LDFDTGWELFRNFRQVLRENLKEDWITPLQVQAPPQTEVGLRATLADWKRTFLHVDQRQEMVDYVLSLKKPD